MKTSWTRFLIQMWPVVKELLHELYRWHKGDVEAATQALRRIKDHGLRLDEAELAVDARIAAVRDKEQS